MNKRIIAYVVGIILLLEAVFMCAPLAVSCIYREPAVRNAFLIAILIAAVAGGLLYLAKPAKKVFYAKEGFAIVALSWILLSAVGAIPFVLTGATPNYIDAFFETVSGFTTTGATVLSEIEPLGYGLLFWRSFTHWIGGMGVLVFMLLILPMAGGNSLHLLRAESTGPAAAKLVPKMRTSARILYGMYIALSLIMLILLLFGGLSPYDALIQMFGTAGTGGFSNHSESVLYFHSAYVDILTGIFMMAFGVNFNLYFLLLMRRGRSVLKNEELRWYLGIMAFAVITIGFNLRPQYESFGEAFRYSFFQVSSVMTTTGYATADFNLWPEYSRMLLVLLMFAGACAGSTGGGLKISRLILLFKSARRELKRQLHPRLVEQVHMDHKTVDETILRNISAYLAIFCMTGAGSLLVISLDQFSFTTNITAVIACMNNVGPGLDLVGPIGNFGGFSYVSKVVLCFDMLAGRLEFFPMLLIFAPSFWRQIPKRYRRIG